MGNNTEEGESAKVSAKSATQAVEYNPPNEIPQTTGASPVELSE